MAGHSPRSPVFRGHDPRISKDQISTPRKARPGTGGVAVGIDNIATRYNNRPDHAKADMPISFSSYLAGVLYGTYNDTEGFIRNNMHMVRLRKQKLKEHNAKQKT